MFLCPAILFGQKDIQTEHYRDLRTLWDDLYYNRLKRKRLTSESDPVIVQVSNVRADFVLDGPKGFVGTLVVTDIHAEESFPLVAFLHISANLKDSSPPLEGIRKGDRLSFVGVITTIDENGKGKASNADYNGIHFEFCRYSRVTK